MATKGIPIDFNKKYRMEDGTRINRMEQDELNSSGYYPIIAYFYSPGGIENFLTYTEDGFFKSSKERNLYNLVLDEDAIAQPLETNKRKVIQISASTFNSYTPELYALCDDGAIFTYEDISQTEDTKMEWRKLPEIPQD